uniref:Ammonium transporter n=1 Tax=Palpitomonas bilix TaxID=652834 RepID=A0A7S3DLT4_9EUKA|mmetsp:Transcript_42696/g.110007  ORF Transcript_42696/g.110007 Transcript_42696/m.110007 type:complete len:506 (+) Transcript_42696:60-1577(+)
MESSPFVYVNGSGTYLKASFIASFLEEDKSKLNGLLSAQEYTISGDVTSTSPTAFWLLLGGVLVFFMQAGFAMLEVGSVRAKNAINIALKNTIDVSLGGLAFWIMGWALAYGDANGNGFIGGSEFFLIGQKDFALWLFQFAFAATAATIVSGAVAERTRFRSYLVYTFLITGFIYPVVVHWVWSSTGFLSAFNSNGHQIANGMIDFAGSGVVHMTGGVAALCGAIFVGARKGRFEDGKSVPIPGHNPLLSCLGVFILWFGWYGFNAGSTLLFTGGAEVVASRAAMTTTLAAGGSLLTTLILGRIAFGYYDLIYALNGALAGLVSITAGCSVVDAYAAVLIGIIGAIVYFGASEALKKLKIDDPLEAAPIHFAAGAWGVISVGFFATPSNVAAAYGDFGGYNNISSSVGIFYEGNGTLLGVQILGVLCIIAWSGALSSLTFFSLRMMKILRIDEECEVSGMDRAFHGGAAYPEFENSAAGEAESESSPPPVRVETSTADVEMTLKV